MSDKTETKPPKLSAAQVGCLRAYLAGELPHGRPEATLRALRSKGLLPRRRTDVEAPILRAAIDAVRPHLTAEELARAEARYEAVAAREADEEREAVKLRGWLTRHGGFDADVLEDRGLHKLQAFKAECLRLAGRWNKAADQIHAAAVACCAADRIEAPPPPDQMIAGIQNRHLGAWRWAGIIFGPQTASATDWKHQYEIEVLDLREDYVAMQERALAEKKRANEAEAKLADLSLVCAHCGPESAGPAPDAPRSCATCYGALILTDAAGAAELRRRYDEAVTEAAGEVVP